jgi:poly(hydroxyalkanoate) depolymerase family esterase
MRQLLFIFLLFAFSSRAQKDTMQEILGFGPNPGNLSLFYYTPKNAANLKNPPLVVVLHGCTQTANSVARLSGWNDLADQYGFYVLYPQQHFPNNPQHCFNWFKNNEIERGKGECESIKVMVDYMHKNFSTDAERVFVTGLSAGAAMSVVMIATQPGMFKAAAIFAGGPYKPGKNIFSSSGSMVWGVNKTPEEWKELVWQQNPAFKGKYPRVLVFHGTNDPVVNFQSAKEIVKQWTCLHKTDTIPDEVIEHYLNANDVTRIAYKNKEQEEVVVFYKINDMGHALPVNPGTCDNQGGHKALFATDKSFYSTYYTACEFGLVPNWKINGPDQLVAGEKNVLYSVAPKKDFTYEWQLPNDVEVVGNKNSNEIKVNWGVNGGSVNLVEIAPNTCHYFHSPVLVKVK